MNARATLCLAAGLLAAMLVVLLWLRPRGAADAGSPPAAATRPESHPAAHAATLAAAREAVGPTQSGPQTVVSVLTTVRIVEAGTRVPVAGAAVWVLGGDWPQAPDLEVWAREAGTPLTADAQGEVRAAGIAGRGVAVARTGELYVELCFRAEPREELVVEVSRDALLTVLVAHAGGAPAPGARVLLYEHPPASSRPWPRLDARTDAAGRATFPHLLQRLRSDDRNGGFVPEGLVAKALLVGSFAAAEPFSIVPPPREPILLVLPPTGRVVVRLSDPRPAIVSLAPADRREEAVLADADAGVATFGQVPLGLSLFAGGSITVRPRSVELEPRQFVGPSRDGEQVEVVRRLAPAEERPKFVGRLLGEDKAPAAGEQFSLVTRFGDRGRDMLGGKTDADGRFACELAKSAIGRPLRELTVTLFGTKGGTEAERLAAVRRELVVGAGQTDLGEIVATLPPLICGVDIVAADDTPVAKANVTLVERVGERIQMLSNLDFAHFTRSPRPGHYEVRGVLGDARPLLSVQHADFVATEPIEFTAGQDGLRVVLQRGQAFAAEVLLDAGFVPHQFRATLRTPHQQGRGTAGAMATLAAGKAGFVWRAIAPGGYELVVWSLSDPDPVAVVPDVRIEPAAEARPVTVDLRGRLHGFGVVVAPVAKATLSNSGTVRVPSALGTVPGMAMLQQGKAVVVSARTSVPVEVFVPGCRSKALTLTQPETRVEMTPGLRVRVRSDGLDDPRTDGLCAALVRDGYEIQRGSWQQQMHLFAGDGAIGERIADTAEFEFVVAGPGPFRLIVGQRRGDSLELVAPSAWPMVTVADSAEPQALTARVR